MNHIHPKWYGVAAAVSYGAFLLLIMSASVKGIAITAALFILGACFLLKSALKVKIETGAKLWISFTFPRRFWLILAVIFTNSGCRLLQFRQSHP